MNEKDPRPPRAFPFSFQDEREAFQCEIFRVHQKTAVTKKKETLKIYTLACANWVNVVPVTSDGQILLIEQHRFGSDSFVWEVPGGAIDKGENDPTMAAVRELEEETGFTSRRVISLASVYANPALQNNRVYYFVAFDVYPLAKLHPADPFEDIQIHAYPVAEVMQMVRSGQISHSLSALALLMAEPYLPK